MDLINIMKPQSTVLTISAASRMKIFREFWELNPEPTLLSQANFGTLFRANHCLLGLSIFKQKVHLARKKESFLGGVSTHWHHIFLSRSFENEPASVVFLISFFSTSDHSRKIMTGLFFLDKKWTWSDNLWPNIFGLFFGIQQHRSPVKASR